MAVVIAGELYDTAFGWITSPGKFEGQEVWVPVAYEETLDGGWPEEIIVSDGVYITAIPITEEEIIRFDLDEEYEDGEWLVLEIDTQGFVEGYFLSNDEWNLMLDRESQEEK